ncbi:MAG: TldD/PmbA family protein [bacterium]
MDKKLIPILKEELEKHSGYDSELFVLSGRSQELSLHGSDLENSEQASYEGMGLRLFRDNKMAFSYSNMVSLERLRVLFKKVQDALIVVGKDNCYRLPLIQSNREAKEDDLLNIRDDKLFSVNALERQGLLEESAKQALNFDKRIKQILRSAYSQAEAQMWLINSNGGQVYEQSTYCGTGFSCLADANGDTQVGSYSAGKRYFDDIDFKFVALESAKRTCALLEGKKIPSGRSRVLLDPTVAVDFLDLIATSVNADMIQKKKSFLVGMIKKKIGSSALNIVDDPTLSKGLGSSHFDDEGIPTSKLSIVKQGVFENMLYDTYTANKDNVASTGNASRGSFKTLPSPGSSNFLILPGIRTREDMISDIQNGVYVMEVMGMHMADPISGDFSVGIAGIRIEKGEMTHSVKGITLAGNLRDFMNSVCEVGSDTAYFGSYGSPTILVDGLMIGG